MKVVEEVAPVERQPARQLGCPEGEEPAAQVAPLITYQNLSMFVGLFASKGGSIAERTGR